MLQPILGTDQQAEMFALIQWMEKKRWPFLHVEGRKYWRRLNLTGRENGAPFNLDWSCEETQINGFFFIGVNFSLPSFSLSKIYIYLYEQMNSIIQWNCETFFHLKHFCKVLIISFPLLTFPAQIQFILYKKSQMRISMVWFTIFLRNYSLLNHICMGYHLCILDLLLKLFA